MPAKKRPRVIIFPIDCMKGKSKKIYMNIGKVVYSNMYDQIENVPKIEEILAMDKKLIKNVLTTIKGKYNNKILAQHWKITIYKMYDILKEQGVELRASNRSKQPPKAKGKGSEQEVAITLVRNEQEEIKAPIETEIMQTNTVYNYIENESEGLVLRYLKPSETGERISNKILTYISNLDKNTKYKVKLLIEEIEEGEQLAEIV